LDIIVLIERCGGTYQTERREYFVMRDITSPPPIGYVTSISRVGFWVPASCCITVSPTCDAADVKSIIQLFPRSSQHVTGNSSHSLSDEPLQIIDIRTLRDSLSIRTQDMDLASVVFVKYIFESVYFILNNPVYTFT
jgi:hypothetical protein